MAFRHVCDPMVVPHGAVVLEQGNHRGQQGTPAVTLPHRLSGLRRAVDGGVVSVPQALDGSPRCTAN